MAKIKIMEKEIKNLSNELKRTIENLKKIAEYHEKIGNENLALILEGRIEAYQTIERRLNQIIRENKPEIARNPLK